MERFQFTNTNDPKNSHTEETIFKGEQFYEIYKHSEFLRNSENVELILSKGYELRQKLKDLLPGHCLNTGLILERNTPLLILKTGPKVNVENYQFTYNRLAGLVAAYAFEERIRFPVIISSEATALGLVWDNGDQTKCRLYLSAVSGTEHFINQFSYWPLLCALRKFQLKKITLEPIIKMAKIKDDNEMRMSKLLFKNYSEALKLWQHFPGSDNVDLRNLLSTAPKELKSLFFD